MRHLYQDALGRLVYQTSLTLCRNFQKHLDPFGITMEQYGILATLWTEEGIALGELSHRVNKDHTNITRIVDKLEKKELIRRSPHPEDRRSTLLYVTDKGRRLREEIRPVAEQVVSQETEGISMKEQQLVRDVLLRMCNNVKERGE